MEGFSVWLRTSGSGCWCFQPGPLDISRCCSIFPFQHTQQWYFPFSSCPGVHVTVQASIELHQGSPLDATIPQWVRTTLNPAAPVQVNLPYWCTWMRLKESIEHCSNCWFLYLFILYNQSSGLHPFSFTVCVTVLPCVDEVEFQSICGCTVTLMNIAFDEKTSGVLLNVAWMKWQIFSLG